MRRFCIGLCALAVGALLLPGAGLGSAPPRAALRGFTCVRGLDPVDRSVGVTAVMRPLPGTRHLAIKVNLLLSHGPGTAPKAVRAGDLGVWISPENPTLGQLAGDVWNLQKSVVDLAVAGEYRFRVQYRWTGADHHVLGTAARLSRRCMQRELRPDLQVASITVSTVAGQPDRNLYSALIANTGNTAAGPFDVLFAPADGSTTTTRAIPLLRAHTTLTETFTGPICTAGTAPTVTADSADQVDDLNRENNSLRANCPAPAGG